MARLEDLIDSVADGDLAAALRSEVKALKERTSFGLVFERHIPETALLSVNRGLRVGDQVRRRAGDPSDEPLEVISVNASKAEVSDGNGQAASVKVSDLFVVKRFGEPIFPALTSVGAGAIGGYLGGILTARGADVTLVARGAQHAALSTNGVRLEGTKSGRPEPIRVKVCKPGEERGPYELIFIGLKAHQIAENAAHLARLLAPGGMLLFPQNGIPWWYFEQLDSPLRGTRLPSLDPDGVLARTFPIEAVIGAVTYKPADLYEPGCIRLADQVTDRLVIGELDNRLTPRLEAIRALIEPAGWPVLATGEIRTFKWRKLLSNAVFNPLGALTQSSALQLVKSPGTRRHAREAPAGAVKAWRRGSGRDSGASPWREDGRGRQHSRRHTPRR